MKRLLPLVCIVLLLNACSKNNDHPAGPDGEEEPGIPPATPLVTEIVGSGADPDNVAYTNIFVYHAQKNWSLNKTFLIEGTQTDKYFTRLILNDPSGVEKNKTLALTSSGLNYVRLKPMRLAHVGNVQNATGGVYGSDNTGSITFSMNGIYQRGNPGFYGPGVTAPVMIGHLPPGSIDMGLSQPCYPAADENNKRQFLQTFGILDVQLGYTNPVNGEHSYEIYGGYYAILKLRIPDNPPVAVPDSIGLWRLIDGQWQRAGTAKKEGQHFIATITRLGAYNFAIPVPGKYRNIRILSSAGLPVVNASVRIRNKGMVIHESQTDWAGNLFAFLPDAPLFDLEIYHHSRSGSVASLTAQLSTAGAKDTLAVTLSPSRFVFSLKGQATQCNGTPINKGKLLCTNPTFQRTWHIPITNGTYQASVIDDDYENWVYTLKAIDLAQKTTGVDTAVMVASSTPGQFVVNTCAMDSTLYMRVSIDGVPVSDVNGHLRDPNNPVLRVYKQTDNKTMMSSGYLQFSTHGTQLGVYTGSGIMDLYVNGKYYNYDVFKPMRVAYSRYDLQSGFVAGTAEFNYVDGGVSRHLTCSFKLWKHQ